MIFGYSTNAFVNYDVFTSVRKIAALGFRGVEVMCDRPHLYPPDWGPADRLRLKELLDAEKLTPTNLNSFTLFAVGDTYLPSWIEPEAERREIRVRHTLDCLEIAREIGCANISVPPGGPIPEGMSRGSALSLFRRELERVLPKAEETGVRVLVEPEPDLLMERTSEIKPFVEEIQSPFLGVNFDIGHFFCAGENPEEAFEELFPWVGHVHVEDIAPTRIHNHLICGKGAIDFRSVFSTMVRLGYRGHMSLELYPYTDRPEAAGRESLEYLMGIISETGLPVEGV